LTKLDNPSDTPSITPSHAAATPIVARNVGRTVVAISCDQSLNKDASPTPSTVRFNHRIFVFEFAISCYHVAAAVFDQTGSVHHARRTFLPNHWVMSIRRLDSSPPPRGPFPHQIAQC